MFRRCSKSLLIATHLALVPGCIKADEPAAVKTVPGSVTVVGHLTDLTGRAASDVQVFAEDLPEVVTTSDANGGFSATIDSATLLRLSGSVLENALGYRLYFASRDTVAVSSVVSFAARGEVSVGQVTLTKGASVSGKVILVPENRLPLPADGAVVRIGRSRTTTSPDGTFTVAQIPSAELTIHASAARYAASRQVAMFAPGELKTLDKPIRLFPESGIVGTIEVITPVDLATLVQSGHPFMRSFRVDAVDQARYVRYHHDEVGMLTSPWKEIESTFDYDFPRDGGNTLFYQFADESQKELSRVYRLTVILDQFGDSKGLVIDNGLGIINRRTVLLHIDAPPAAFRMRLSESQDILILRPWQKTAKLLEYTFEMKSNNGLNAVEGFGQKTIYLQFEDALGNPSPVFSATALLELFPASGQDVFTINDGAPESEQRLARLDIRVPANAHEMRIFEAQLDGNNMFGMGGGEGQGGDQGRTRSTRDIWLKAQPRAFFTFPSPGLKSLYLQFRTADGVVSPVYSQVVRILPFQEADVGFTINGGAPVSLTRHLSVTLVPPVTATAFRIFEGSMRSQWLTLVPSLNFSVNSPGVHTLNVQFRNDDLEESPTFQQTINVDPFPPGDGDFLIEGGAFETLSPTVNLTIIPPATARYMAITENSFPNSTMGGAQWLELAANATLTVKGNAGSKTILVKFMNEDGDESAALQQSIFFDPFPQGAAGLVIDNGALETSDTSLDIVFFGPAHLDQMRFGLSPTSLSTQPWTESLATSTVTIPTAPGTIKVYVQYRTTEGLESPVYFDEITSVVPPPPPPGP